VTPCRWNKWSGQKESAVSDSRNERFREIGNK